MVSAEKLAQLRAAVERLAPIEDHVWASIVPFVRVVRMPRGAYFLRAGDRARAFGWVVRGIVRKFYVSTDGREHNAAFTAEGGPFGSYTDLVSGEPSRTSIECLEDVEALVVDWADFEAVCAREPGWHEVVRAVSTKLLETKTARESALLTQDAEARYARLLATSPDLVARVPAYHLASYLGMRPEHLSRVRSRLAKKPVP